METYTETKCKVQEGDKIFFQSEDAYNKSVKSAQSTTPPSEPPVLLASQTFQYSLAQTEEVMAILCPDVAVRIAQFNKGQILSQHNEARDLLLEEGFTPKEGVYDLAYAAAQVAERRKQSPEEKAAKALGISAEQLRAALELIKGQATVSA